MRRLSEVMVNPHQAGKAQSNLARLLLYMCLSAHPYTYHDYEEL